MVSKITSVSVACSSVWSGGDQRKHRSSASLAFVRGIHRQLVDFFHKGSVTRKMFAFDDVIMFDYDFGGENWELNKPHKHTRLAAGRNRYSITAAASHLATRS